MNIYNYCKIKSGEKICCGNKPFDAALSGIKIYANIKIRLRDLSILD